MRFADIVKPSVEDGLAGHVWIARHEHRPNTFRRYISTMSSSSVRLRVIATSTANSAPGRVALGLAGRRFLTCIGDSHLQSMWTVKQQRMLPKTILRVVSITGATASGIQNPNSQVQAGSKFQAATATLRPGAHLLSCLGEVDAGFLVFKLAERNGTNPREQADVAFGRYAAFLAEQVLRRKAKLLVLSVIPPTIRDYSSWTGLQGQRRDIDASWQERSDMTSYWNELTSAWCDRVGATWLDQTPFVTESDTGRVSPEWLNLDREDHHLAPAMQAALIASLLRKHGFQ